MARVKRNYNGINNPNWKGGRKFALGYKLVLCKDHPNADRKGYVQEHRLVMENYIGRLLDISEPVHHLNGNKLDNRIENLVLCKNNSEHIKKYHSNNMSEKRYAFGVQIRVCKVCSNDFNTRSPNAKFCQDCKNQYGWRIYNKLEEILL